MSVEVLNNFSGKGKAVAKSRNVDPKVLVTYVRTLGSEMRISRAIDILLAATYSDEDSTVRTDENEVQENVSSGNDDEGNFAGEGR